MSGLPQGTSVAVMTYASDLFSWYAGSLEADVYFCPERHGTYYGGFYIKDAPAVGHEGYSIDEQLTATAGRALSDASAGYVTESQAAVMSSLVAAQKDNLFASPTANIVDTRTAIAAQLRTLLLPIADAPAVKARVLELSALYGELDGANNHAYATVFAQANRSLTSEQRVKLAALRKSIMSGTYADGTPFDFSTNSTPYLYSSAITDPNVLTAVYRQHRLPVLRAVRQVVRPTDRPVPGRAGRGLTSERGFPARCGMDLAVRNRSWSGDPWRGSGRGNGGRVLPRQVRPPLRHHRRGGRARAVAGLPLLRCRLRPVESAHQDKLSIAPAG
jgi:hypothetical protein